jgi:restriction endonuclease S subunit
MRLRDIATIQTGVLAKTELDGDILYLQAKHFDDDAQLLEDLKPDLKHGNVSEKHILRHGDVLFAAKGSKNFATTYDSENGLAVASTSFFVIRAESKLIHPEFLAWFLNRSVGQKYLKKHTTGSITVSVSKSVLEEMEIPVPPVNRQQIIIEIAELMIREKQLRTKIEELKKKKINKLIETFI